MFYRQVSFMAYAASMKISALITNSGINGVLERERKQAEKFHNGNIYTESIYSIETYDLKRMK